MARALRHSTWLAGALRLLRPQPRPDEADPLAPPTIETSILRLPLSIANELRACTSVLESLEPDHYYYPPESMHVTLAAPGSGRRGRSAVEDVRAIKITELLALTDSQTDDAGWGQRTGHLLSFAVGRARGVAA